MASLKPTSESFSFGIPALAIACAVVSVFFTSGCSSIGTKGKLETELAKSQSDLPTYKVILADVMGGEPTIYVGHISKPMTVQDALVDSGAVDKFKGMKIDLARKVPDRSEVLRLEINYDHKESKVIEEWNYAIHPGDEILVHREDVGALSAVFKSLGG